MTAIIICLLVVLVVTVIILFVALKKLKYYKVAMGNMSAMVIMQRMFELMSSTIPASKKMEELNNIILEAFDTKYSSLVTFDGSEYEVQASNVEPTFLDSLLTIAAEQDFKGNVSQNISKYLVAADTRLLSYKTALERKIRSVMFSPIYYNGVYKGFWMMEDEASAAYDHISKEELARIKDNIGVFIENISMQASIENAHNTDKQTGFYNNLYLYSTLRQKLANIENSAVTMISLANLPTINNEYGRELGNRLLEKSAKYLSEIMSQDSVLIRYSGSKFCIICPGTTADLLHTTIEKFLRVARTYTERFDEDEVALDFSIVMHTVNKQNNMEKEINKVVSYVEGMRETNTIKII